VSDGTIITSPTDEESSLVMKKFKYTERDLISKKRKVSSEVPSLMELCSRCIERQLEHTTRCLAFVFSVKYHVLILIIRMNDSTALRAFNYLNSVCNYHVSRYVLTGVMTSFVVEG
jgi:hypothetical protein